MTFYRPILKKAWQITKHYKFLWFFGLFAALLGNGGEFEIFYNNIARLKDQPESMSAIRDLYSTGRFEEIFRQASQFFSSGSALSIVYTIFIILLFILLVWLIIISHSAIIFNVQKNQKGERSNFAESFQIGRHFFKPVFLVNLYSRLIIYLLFLVLCVPFLYFYLQNAAAGHLLSYMILSFIIFVPIGIIVSFIAKYATAFVVIKGLPVGQAIREGWRLFIGNWLISLEMVVVLFLINLLAGVGFFIGFVLIALPFLLLALVFYTAASVTGLYVILIPAGIIFFVALFVVGSMISVFQFSAWILTFMKLTEGKVFSKLIRIFHPAKVK